MSFLGLGLPELVVILALAYFLLGPKRMMEAARGLAGIMKELRQQRDEFTRMVTEEFDLKGEQQTRAQQAPPGPERPDGAVGRPRRLQDGWTASETAASDEGAEEPTEAVPQNGVRPHTESER